MIFNIKNTNNLFMAPSIIIAICREMCFFKPFEGLKFDSLPCIIAIVDNASQNLAHEFLVRLFDTIENTVIAFYTKECTTPNFGKDSKA